MMLCILCGIYINPNYAQRVVSTEGKLGLACRDDRTCNQIIVVPVVVEPVITPRKVKSKEKYLRRYNHVRTT